MDNPGMKDPKAKLDCPVTLAIQDRKGHLEKMVNAKKYKEL